MATLRELPWGRHALVFTIAMVWWLSSILWVGSAHFPMRVGLAWLIDPFVLSSFPVWLGLTAILAVATVAFWLRRREGLAAWAIVVVLFAAGSAESSFIGRHAPSLGLVLACNLVFAWEVGRWWGRSTEDPDHVAHEMACGLYGAQLSIAAVSKLVLTGLDWRSGHALALMIYERGIVGEDALSPLRMWVANHPWTANLGSTYTLLIQLAGFLFLWPRLRRLYMILLMPMFLGFAFLMGMWEPLWPLMGFALAWSSFGHPRPRA